MKNNNYLDRIKAHDSQILFKQNAPNCIKNFKISKVPPFALFKVCLHQVQANAKETSFPGGFVGNPTCLCGAAAICFFLNLLSPSFLGKLFSQLCSCSGNGL